MQSDGPGDGKQASAPEGLLGQTGDLVEEWLTALEESRDGLLGSCGRGRLRQAIMASLGLAAETAVTADCLLPEGALRQAADSLRRRLLRLSHPHGQGEPARQFALLACERILRATINPGGRRDASGDTAAGVTSAAILAETAEKIQQASSAMGVKRLAVAAAARICAAPSAAWWDQREPSAGLLAASWGAKLPRVAKEIRIGRSFWGVGEAGQSVVALSAENPAHRELLAAAKASDGIAVRVRAGGKAAGVLAVFSGTYSEERIALLTALAQHSAAACRALELAAERKQMTRGQQRSASDVGVALSSALSLEELLALICQSASDLAQSDGCVIYLAGPEGELSLRAATSPELRSPAAAALSGIAQLARSQPLGRPLVRPAPRSMWERGYRAVLGVVLSVRGDPVGALLLVSRRPEAFDRACRELIVSFAAQAAVAAENLQLIEDMQRRLLEMADLTWVSTRISAAMDVERIAATVAEAASKALDVPRTALFLVSEDGKFAPIKEGQRGMADGDRGPLPKSGHVGSDALTLGVPQVIGDAGREGKADDELVQWLGVHSLLAVPMVAQQGLKGILVVGSEEAREFPSHAVALLCAYANHTALALQSAVLYQNVVRHLRRLEHLFQVSQTLTSSLELTQTLQGVLDAASELVDAPVGTLMLVEEEPGQLVIKAAKGVREDDDLHRPLKLGEGLAGKAAQSGAVLVSADISRDGRFAHRTHARQGGLRAAIAAPLVARGRRVGVLSLYRASSRAFDEDDRRVVMALANTAAIAIENARLYEETQERAQFLTAMMSEINHRVRNSLQAVAGLLRMEMDQQPPRPIERVLGRAMARLQSVAVVHDMLSSPQLRFVDMKQAARRIVQLTCQTAAPGAEIETTVSGARVTLPSQQATNVAMVLSELVDNAIRHGLADSKDGRVLVNLAEGGGYVVIEVKDNGKSVPEGFDLERDSGLGLKVARALVEEELEGTLSIESNNGLTVRARFPKRV